MQEALDALESYKKKDPSKGACARVRSAHRPHSQGPPRAVVVRFKAVGNAPIMKQNLYKITASNRFQAVIQFLRKELGWKANDPLVCIRSSLPSCLSSANRSHRHTVYIH